MLKQHWLRFFYQFSVTLFLILTLNFFMLRLLPGGPLDEESSLSSAVRVELEKNLDLYKSIFEQYWLYISKIFRGDLGVSFVDPTVPVVTILAEALGASIKLGAFAFVFAFIFAIPAGLYAAYRPQQRLAKLIDTSTVVFLSMPSFFLAPLLIWFFSIKLSLLPLAFLDSSAHYILPCLALALRPWASLTKILRKESLSQVKSDYVRAARARGLAERQILTKHVLKNALPAVVGYAAPMLAGILSGSFVVELIFSIPGMGYYFVEALSGRDYGVILGLTLVYSVCILIINFVSDILLSYLDPRVVYEAQ